MRTFAVSLLRRSLARHAGHQASGCPTFARIDHVALPAYDLNRAVEWYRKVLGFRPCRPDDPGFHNADIRMIEAAGDASVDSILLGARVKIALLRWGGGADTADGFFSGRHRRAEDLKLVGGTHQMAEKLHGVQATAELEARQEEFRSRRGHVALGLDDEDAFQHLRHGGLAERLRRSATTAATGSAADPLLWIDYQDYGVQESLFFHDLDLNELEITRWKVGAQ